jgi:chromosome segregation ATPase
MGSHEELERRVSTVEEELVAVRHDAAEARALAAGADRDVSDSRAEYRGHRRLLQALRETQLEHYAEHKRDHAELKSDLGEVKARLSGVETGLAGLDGRMSGFEGRLSGVETGLGVVVRMLEGMGGRAD